MLKDLYRNLFNGTAKSVKKKLKDANTLKSNFANPHNRQVVIPGVPRLLFSALYSGLLLPKENSRKVNPGKRTSPLFELKYLHRLEKVFSSDSLSKIHSGGDVTIIAPWMVLKENIVVNDTTTFEPQSWTKILALTTNFTGK